MRKIFAIFVLTFMMLTLLVSCQDTAQSDDVSKGEQNDENTNNNEQNDQDNQGNQNIVPMPPEYIGGDETNEPPIETPDTSDDEEVIPDGEQSGEGSGAGESTAPGESGGNVDPDGETVPDGEGDADESVITPEVTPDLVVGTEVGNLFHDLTLQTVAGGSVNTADYRGKILVVNIWATWCPPCKAELPDFNRIASEYSDDVVIIAAHTPSGNANAASYINTNFPETNIIFAYDTVYSEAFLAAGGTEYVPQTAIIDQNGVIIYADSGMMTYDQVMAIIEDYL